MTDHDSSTPTQAVCVKVWLRAASEARVQEWAEHINAHRAEAMKTLRDEGVTVESVFLDRTPDAPCLIYYMRLESEARAKAAGDASAHAIDLYHRAFKRDTWVKVERLELLVDLS